MADGAPEQDLTVADGLIVSMEYTLCLDDGEVYDTSEGKDPIHFFVGHSQVIPGLESQLYGLRVGDQKQVVVPASQGYGEVDPDAYQEVGPDFFPEDVVPQVGLQLQVQDEQGNVYDGVVWEMNEGTILVNFNHPLAGETLHFDVRITDVRQPTEVELQHGHPHVGYGPEEEEQE